MGNLAEVQPGKLAKMAERKKSREQFATCHKAGWEFCPFIVETQGTWGGPARHLMQRIICLWSLKKGCPESEAAVSCTGSISTAVLRGVGRQLERGFPAKVQVMWSPRGISTACSCFPFNNAMSSLPTVPVTHPGFALEFGITKK